MRLTFYRDTVGAWRWRLVHRNGRVVGASSEGYSRRIDCVSNAALVTRYRLRPGVKVAGKGVV